MYIPRTTDMTVTLLHLTILEFRRVLFRSTQSSSTTYLSLHILRVTMQCKGISTYVQHKVPVPVLLYALTPLSGGTYPSYTARDDEEAVPSGGGCPYGI